MADEEKKVNRPWWKKKTNWGLILYAVGEGMIYFPVTMPFAPIVKVAGTLLAGYGVADRVTKK